MCLLKWDQFTRLKGMIKSTILNEKYFYPLNCGDGMESRVLQGGMWDGKFWLFFFFFLWIEWFIFSHFESYFEVL